MYICVALVVRKMCKVAKLVVRDFHNGYWATCQCHHFLMFIIADQCHPPRGYWATCHAYSSSFGCVPGQSKVDRDTFSMAQSTTLNGKKKISL